MSKDTIVNKIAEEAEVSKAEAQRILNVVGSAIGEQIVEEGEAALPGVGKFKTVERAARTARNPQSGDTVKVPARNVVKFVVAKSLKESVA